MRAFLILALLLLFVHPGQAGTCRGEAGCTACSNCQYCKHCKAGGTCGVCSRGATRPAAASSSSTAPKPATKVAAGRCQATTKKGTQCSRNAQSGRDYCYQH